MVWITVAIDANNIGQILKAKGDLEGALSYTRRALKILESSYGRDNPTTRQKDFGRNRRIQAREIEIRGCEADSGSGSLAVIHAVATR